VRDVEVGELELAGVGKTALGVALVRAHESRRPDRLFDDPYAAAFVAAAPAAFPDAFPGRTAAAADPLARVGAAFAVSAVLRTRFFDDYLRQARAAQVRSGGAVGRRSGHPCLPAGLAGGNPRVRA